MREFLFQKFRLIQVKAWAINKGPTLALPCLTDASIVFASSIQIHWWLKLIKVRTVSEDTHKKSGFVSVRTTKSGGGGKTPWATKKKNLFSKI